MPVAVLPYHYPQLLNCAGVTLTFSPGLLVKKHNETWRFYVNYPTLNAKPVKDKFPIPIINELLEELKGACFFTKLDLRSGYHQVLMHPPDMEKTIFRTHHRHYGFFVMPFGLINALDFPGPNEYS